MADSDQTLATAKSTGKASGSRKKPSRRSRHRPSGQGNGNTKVSERQTLEPYGSSDDDGVPFPPPNPELGEIEIDRSGPIPIVRISDAQLEILMKPFALNFIGEFDECCPNIDSLQSKIDSLGPKEPCNVMSFITDTQVMIETLNEDDFNLILNTEWKFRGFSMRVYKYTAEWDGRRPYLLDPWQLPPGRGTSRRTNTSSLTKI